MVISGARWFFEDDVVDLQSGNLDTYYIEDIRSRLIIPSNTFMSSKFGPYTCRMSSSALSGDTINLDGGGEYLAV